METNPITSHEVFLDLIKSHDVNNPIQLTYVSHGRRMENEPITYNFWLESPTLIKFKRTGRSDYFEAEMDNGTLNWLYNGGRFYTNYWFARKAVLTGGQNAQDDRR